MHPIRTARDRRSHIASRTYVYAFSVASPGENVSGWVPAACIGWNGTHAPAIGCTGSSSGTPSDFPIFGGRKPLAKYDAVEQVIIATPDEMVKQFPPLKGVDTSQVKISCNLTGADQSLSDYLPRLSADGTFYKMNLAANVPGLHPPLGGIAVDTFVIAHVQNGQVVSSNVTFHRFVHVNTIDVYLFQPGSSNGAPTEGAHVKFGYGYITYPTGKGWARRYGWIPNFATHQL